MTQFTEAVSPLRQRMIDDMNMRRLSPKTQIGYIRAVTKLATYLKHSPAHATAEELRQFQIAMAEQGASNITINSTLSGLQFLFCKTLNRPDVVQKLSTVPTPRKLPQVLSVEEVKRLIAAAHNLKYRTALSVAYGAGLRVSEVVALKVTDVDSKRMVLRIEQGKGNKDRLAMLSPVLLGYLRDWWRYAHAQQLMLNGGWLFPGQQAVNPISTRQLSRACKAAAHDADIDKRVSMHTLRHSFATHLLEAKVDIRVIQTLLGHSKLETTALYAQVATKLLHEVVSPLDALKLSH
jgi:integrase/recombinase XerD